MTEFGLGLGDASSDNNSALRAARAGGHLAVARWLTVAFGLTASATLIDRERLPRQLARESAGASAALIRWLAGAFYMPSGAQRVPTGEPP